MKSLMPWFCLVAATGAAFANDDLEAYRQGHYMQAATKLGDASGKDPVVDYYMGRMRLYGYGQLKNNTLALRHFNQSAEKGFLPAQKIMANYALLEEKNPEQALYWFKKAADAGDTQAQMYCAAAYLYGFGVKKNPGMATKYYIAAAKNGNSIAQYELAEHFLTSRNAKNKSLGLIWLNKAVEQGNPKAQLKLGQLYAAGNQVPRNLDKAKELIELAIAQDYLPALLEMGELARQQKNLTLAKEWYGKAADKNYIPAQIALANLYLQADSPVHDPRQGFLWMLKAAQNHSSAAQLALAKLYEEGNVVPKDDNLAQEWKEEAKESEKETSMNAKKLAAEWLSNGKASTFTASGYRLGGIFSAWHNPDALKENNYNQSPQMISVDRNVLYKPDFTMTEPNEIFISEYYDALANSLGRLDYSDIVFPRYPVNLPKQSELIGAYVPNSPAIILTDEPASYAVNEMDEAFDVMNFLLPTSDKDKNDSNKSLFERLYGEAILGNPDAQFILGQMYENGVEVKQDVQEAIKYYRLATDQKDLRAEYNLGLLYLEGKKTTADYQQGLSLMRDAAFKGNAPAQYVLARLNEQGFKDSNGNEVIKPDWDEATAMYYLASSNDYGPAQFRLAEILVREKQKDLSVAAKVKKNQLIKSLYQDAVLQGIQQAALPLAFFNAMDTDANKQAQAFEVAKLEAAKGNGQAALLLGILYDRGIGTTANPADAIYWYQQASNDPVSAFILGTYYSQGKNINQDMEKGKALLQQSADAGFPYANLNLAVLKQQHGEEFLSELDTARALGNSKAGLLLADYYLSLADDETKMKQARDIYQHFANNGDKLAQLKLAFMYEQGLGGAVDIISAKDWYSKAAEQGQPVAQYLLGRLHQLGKLNQYPDYAEAKKWYEGAQTSYPPAAVALGFIYDTVEDDYQQASQKYELASLQDDPVAQFDLGLIYEKGKGRPVDFEKAKELYLQAANHGHTQAMVQLAGLYFNGAIGPRDEQQALHWYKKAAEAGDHEALYQLGLLSETGVATKLDFADAVNYYQQSSAKDNTKATLALARMYQYGLGIEKNNQQAIELYKKLASLNNPYAQYQLATFYYEGTAGERLPEQGKQLLLRAEKNGSQQARKVLQWLDAQSQERSSYIEPIAFDQTISIPAQPADLMYLDALNEWNRGDEELSRIILNRIMTQFPHYIPAKRAYEQLSQQKTSSIFKA
ncbi:tetratricopeptide repeat protein [Legionella oakridgensis]|uniref:tetratricopeptide repeat protein n=1 Tax=Legionella oakridgensis TaxID=29423 RepID=UPI0003DE06C7|nr:tetratricopeptide repeat protein [Legionella oakridgensis]ETO93836.1 TPR repeat, SEL1 subfamily protein [Legionella oakridgensis RV-2-2007]